MDGRSFLVGAVSAAAVVGGACALLAQRGTRARAESPSRDAKQSGSGSGSAVAAPSSSDAAGDARVVAESTVPLAHLASRSDAPDAAAAARGDASDAGDRVAAWSDAPYRTTFEPSNPWWVVPMLQWVKEGVPAGVLRDAARPPSIDEIMRSLGLGEDTLTFGSTLKRHHFLLDEEVAFLNHGSYGAMLRVVHEVRKFLTLRLESNPVAWMENECLPLLAEALRAMAAFINANPEDVAFVTNATGGVNAAVRSFPLEQGDAVLAFDIGYPACANTIDAVCRQHGAHLVRVTVPFPYSDDALCDAVSAAVAAYPNLRLAVVDHITSMPAVVLPVERIARILSSAGITVVVDGAHCVGGVPLDMAAMARAGVSAYTSNMHKWMCTPKGVAFLWVRDDAQRWVRPTAISHGYGLGFCREFVWQATADYTAYLTVPTAIAFFQRLGHARIMEHNKALLDAGASTVVAAWGGERAYSMDVASTMMCVSLMEGKLAGDANGAREMNATLRRRGVEAPVFASKGKLWVRLSAHIHNSAGDYERLVKEVAAIQSS